MFNEDYLKLLEDLEHEVLKGNSVAILGLTRVTLRILKSTMSCGLMQCIRAIYTNHEVSPDQLAIPIPIRSVVKLAETQYDVIVVAADAEKEDLLRLALPYIQGSPKLIVAGYGHLKFRDPIFIEEVTGLLVPSSANGYPNTLVHAYQCLKNASRLALQGVVVEFGMFKGGTTMFLSRIIERLGSAWPVIGFDTFGGFPLRRNPLDMYDHPDCIFTDLAAVKRLLSGRNIEIIVGDIVETSERLRSENIVVSLIDTDNYSSAKVAIEVVRENTLVGGAIIFDHFTGTNRFRYTLGERMAGEILLEDGRYFHLHDTGVFFRQT